MIPIFMLTKKIFCRVCGESVDHHRKVIQQETSLQSNNLKKYGLSLKQQTSDTAFIILTEARPERFKTVCFVVKFVIFL